MKRSALRQIIISGCIAVGASIGVNPANANRATVLHTFKGKFDGLYPQSVLVEDQLGNIYGTTSGDLDYNGTVFKLSPDGKETVLHKFGSDGRKPLGGVILDAAGNLYGTTSEGGSAFCEGAGCGIVFKIAPDGTESVLYTFSGGTDGANPVASLVMDKKGNLFGTTKYAGTLKCGVQRFGSVFEITVKERFVLLHDFDEKSGENPTSPLIFGNNGELIGTAPGGGDFGAGVVFQIAKDGKFTQLHSFKGGTGGAYPYSGLLIDSGGNLYGTTEEGGQYSSGTIYNLGPDGTETTVHSFSLGADGGYPLSGLAADASGNLYGTTSAGGGSDCYNGSCGVLYRLATDGTFKVQYEFNQTNGWLPAAGVIFGSNGYLYGTAEYGGRKCEPFGCGTVYKIKR